ncbi:OLC1v1005559C1 [Oldenlandia corymbosa var. corymbosa]|uniref:OLC1v1005559C1 n=1 Tax=Oldenlandia corymbosa var. corymbosa TaxID=529605 RepID=A0AAV1DH91_OLDCO|nr:OLC1v1005559C1 [Oldenlandia corymbosa var. corymbosa]
MVRVEEDAGSTTSSGHQHSLGDDTLLAEFQRRREKRKTGKSHGGEPRKGPTKERLVLGASQPDPKKQNNTNLLLEKEDIPPPRNTPTATKRLEDQKLAKIEAELKKLGNDSDQQQRIRRERYPAFDTALEEFDAIYQRRGAEENPDPPSVEILEGEQGKPLRRTKAHNRLEFNWDRRSPRRGEYRHDYEPHRDHNNIEGNYDQEYHHRPRYSPQRQQKHNWHRENPPYFQGDQQGTRDQNILIREEMRKIIGIGLDRSPFFPSIRDIPKPRDFDFPKEFKPYSGDTDVSQWLQGMSKS